MKVKILVFLGAIVGLVIVERAVVCQLYRSRSRYVGPKVHLPEGRRYDFGEIPEDEKIEHIFTIKNIGRETLKILKVTTGCGCTRAQASKTEIEPGESGEIEVIYRARRVRYRDTVASYVKTNDPENPLLELVLTGFVRYNVFWFPESVSFFGKPGSIHMPKEVKFSGPREPQASLELEILSTSSNFVKAQLLQDKEGALAKITLSPECPRGSYVENIMIKYTKNEFTKPITIPVYIMLR